MILDDSGFLSLGSQRLEYRMIGPQPDAAPTLVLLHEGLGCVGLWGDFPDQLQAATGAGVLVYSRAGYGQSSPVPLPRPLSYMHDEARDVLPRLLDAIGFQRGLLIGHSDGASIAAIYAGSHQDHRVGGLVLIAPHFFTEDAGIASIVEARKAYETGDLRARLARWHADVDNAFKGWNGAWLDPEFRKWDITEYPRLYPRAAADRAGRRTINTARSSRSSSRNRSVIARSRWRWCPTRATRRSATRPRRRLMRLQNSSPACCRPTRRARRNFLCRPRESGDP